MSSFLLNDALRFLSDFVDLWVLIFRISDSEKTQWTSQQTCPVLREKAWVSDFYWITRFDPVIITSWTNILVNTLFKLISLTLTSRSL